jgi:CRP-like cAMP-binding protein
MNQPPKPPIPGNLPPTPAPAASAPLMLDEFRDPAWGAEKLKSVSIMRKFTKQELEHIYSQGEVRTFKPKSYAVIEGEPTRGLFIILKGNVSIYKSDETGKTMHRIAMLEEGSNFGELSLFDPAPRAATVAAESICHMFYLDIAKFESSISAFGPEACVRFYRTCAEELAARFRILNADYINSQQLLWKHALRKVDETAAAAAGAGAAVEEGSTFDVES